MTTCPFCLEEMAARTKDQLRRRAAKIGEHPNILVAPCPKCHGTEWATTDYMIEPDPPPVSLWQRIKQRFR